MPLITLEYTDNIKDPIDFKTLFHEVHQTAKKVANVNPANCKSKANALDCYFVGNGENENAYVHLDFFFLEGRSPEMKKSLGEELLKLLQRHYQKASEKFNTQITVRIEDIKRDFHFKYPE